MFYHDPPPSGKTKKKDFLYNLGSIFFYKLQEHYIIFETQWKISGTPNEKSPWNSCWKAKHFCKFKTKPNKTDTDIFIVFLSLFFKWNCGFWDNIFKSIFQIMILFKIAWLKLKKFDSFSCKYHNYSNSLHYKFFTKICKRHSSYLIKV